MQAAAPDFGLIPVFLNGSGVIQGAKSRQGLVVCRIGAIDAVPVVGVPEDIIDETAITVLKCDNAQGELILDQWEIKYQ